MRLGAAIAGAVALGIAAGVGAHVLSPSRSAPRALPLPELHGQATWGSRQRPAPGFTLRNVLGGTVSLASARGRPVLVTFLDSRCRSLCPVIGRAIGAVQRSLAVPARPVVFVVSVDPAGDTVASVRAAARRWSLAPGWRWLSGTRARLAAVWRAYGIQVEPRTNDIVHGAAVYLIDRHGDERAGYLAPVLPGFVALDVRTVEQEA